MENSKKVQTSLLGIINPEELTEVKAALSHIAKFFNLLPYL